jgi:hypothetical protein
VRGCAAEKLHQALQGCNRGLCLLCGQSSDGSELESRKSRSGQAHWQGLCHGPKLPDNKQGSLGVASRPASGREMELSGSNLAQRRATHKALAQVLLACEAMLRSHFCKTKTHANLEQEPSFDPTRTSVPSLTSHSTKLLLWTLRRVC